MVTRRFGRSDLTVSALGMGCWAIGGPFWDAGGWMGYGDVDDAESIRAVQHAVQSGVTFFDTGGIYGCGHSERILGQALAEIGATNNVVIAGKFGYTFDEAKREVTGTDATPAGIRQACEDSLRRLGRDTIDIYQFHLFNYPLEHAVAVRETLEELVTEGKIRWYAWCAEDEARVRLFAEGKHCTAVPQLLNVFDAVPTALALCDELDLAALVRRPLHMGLLTGKFTAETPIAENDMRRRFGWNLQSGKQAVQLQQLEKVRAVLTQEGRTLTQGALGYIWAKSPRAVPVPGAKTVKQVDENAKAMQFGALTTEQVTTIEQLLGKA